MHLFKPFHFVSVYPFVTLKDNSFTLMNKKAGMLFFVLFCFFFRKMWVKSYLLLQKLQKRWIFKSLLELTEQNVYSGTTNEPFGLFVTLLAGSKCYLWHFIGSCQPPLISSADLCANWMDCLYPTCQITSYPCVISHTNRSMVSHFGFTVLSKGTFTYILEELGI